jgi:hypothetical protein
MERREFLKLGALATALLCLPAGTEKLTDLFVAKPADEFLAALQRAWMDHKRLFEKNLLFGDS